MSKSADIISIEINRVNLNAQLARYVYEIGLAPELVVRAQCNLAMRELADKSNPQSQKELARSAETDVYRVYRGSPKAMLPMAHRSGKGFYYISAGPNYLLSAKIENVALGATAEDLKAEFHALKKSGKYSGPAYVEVGFRALPSRFSIKTRAPDRQHIINLNRKLVRRGVIKDLIAWVKSRIGILGGSWCAAWAATGNPSRPPAAFKFRHVLNGTHKGAFINGLGIPGKASFALINRAVGVESPASLRMVAGVLRHRTEAVKVDIKNILRGAYDRAGWSRKK